MSASTAAVQADDGPDQTGHGAPVAAALSPELEEVILEIAASERALDDLLARSARLHDSHLQHDPRSCLVCFGER